MVNFLKKIKLFYLVLGILLVIGSYYYFSVSKKTTTKTTASTTIETVSTGSLKETIDVVGTSELVDEQSLSFNQAGTITAVYFKEGDNVKKGDVIAKLDDSDGQNNVKQAELNVADAKTALSQLYDSPDESKIMQSNNSINSSQDSIASAKVELVNLKVSQENSLESLKNNISTAKISLENSKKSLEDSKTSLELSKKDLELSQKNLEYTKSQQNNSLSNTTSNKSTTIKQVEQSFSSELTNISKIIEQADYIFGVTEGNKDKNDSYEVYLSAKNITYKNQTETALQKSITAYNNLKTNVDNYDNSGDVDKLISLINNLKEVYSSLEDMTQIAYTAIDSSVANDAFTQSEIDSKKSTMYNYTTSIQSKLTSLTSTINTLNTLTDTSLVSTSNENTIASLENSIAQKEASIKSSETSIAQKEADIKSQEISIQKQEKDYETTKKSYDLNITNKENSISQLEKTLDVNKESYKELIEGPKNQEVSKAQNAIIQAQLKLKSAQEALDDYKITAPFDGVLRKIDYKVGDKLNNDTDKSAYIENPNLLEITVMLDQVDIAKVKVGTKAKVTFDAYAGEPADAVISNVDTTPVQSSGVTSYTVTLILDDSNFKKQILSGMTADVEIIVSETSENSLVVSTSAITNEDDKSYVNIMKDGKTIKTEIVTGITGDSKTEVLSGLTLGDKIVITSYTSSSSVKTSGTSILGGSSSRNSSTRSSGGGFGGGPGF